MSERIFWNLPHTREAKFFPAFSATAMVLVGALPPHRRCGKFEKRSTRNKHAGLARLRRQCRWHPVLDSATNKSRHGVNSCAWLGNFPPAAEGGLQTNPLIVGRTMFVYTATEKVVALDAATGKQLWIFDTGVPGNQPNRGFSYWSDGRQNILFAGVMDHLYALNPATGKLIETFGEGGSVDLRKDLGEEDFARNFAVLTTPGTIYKDMIIVGFRAPETQPAPHGDIRAYDVHTGKLRWSFHTIPHPGEARLRDLAEGWHGALPGLQTTGLVWWSTKNAASSSRLQARP